MPRATVKKQSGSTRTPKHVGVRTRFPGQPWRVMDAKGRTQDFLDAMCTLDEEGNLYVVRVPAPSSTEEARTLKVYAHGAWDSFELIVNVVSEPETPAQ